jgi:hypothetical protein
MQSYDFEAKSTNVLKRSFVVNYSGRFPAGRAIRSYACRLSSQAGIRYYH